MDVSYPCAQEAKVNLSLQVSLVYKFKNRQDYIERPCHKKTKQTKKTKTKKLPFKNTKQKQAWEIVLSTLCSVLTQKGGGPRFKLY